MRQDLMRQQALGEEQKELQQKLLHSIDSSSPISVSVSSSCRPAQVPVEVLKVGGEKQSRSLVYLSLLTVKSLDPTFPMMHL